MAPLFSIITVTYNAASTLPATIASIKSQTCKLYEWIVQDNNSTDGTAELVASASIPNSTLTQERDRGIYDAMNRALARATGEYVIFLNAGDALHAPDTLQKIADCVMDTDFPGIVYGLTDVVDADGHRLGSRHLDPPEVLTVKAFRDGMLVCHQAFIALRKLVPQYNLRYRFSSDYDWCIRVMQHSRRNEYIPEVLIDYLNVGMTTKHHRRSLWERFRIMCHYYGTLPTIGRHIGFALRYIKRGGESIKK